MIPTGRFSLEAHDGPYESWGTRSHLLDQGVRCGAQVRGFSLLHQFETPDGFLLVTDDMCPFEETTHFTLLSGKLRVLASRSFGAPYASCLLDDLASLPDGSIDFVLSCQGAFKLSLRSRGIAWIYPRLKFRRLDRDTYLGQLAAAGLPLENARKVL